VKLESQSVLTFGRGVTLVFLINHTFAADLARTMTSMSCEKKKKKKKKKKKRNETEKEIS
jgi:hypothetical protein